MRKGKPLLKLAHHCEPIRLADGRVVFANFANGGVLTDDDKAVLAEWAQFCVEYDREEQRKRNKAMLPGNR